MKVYLIALIRGLEKRRIKSKYFFSGIIVCGIIRLFTQTLADYFFASVVFVVLLRLVGVWGGNFLFKKPTPSTIDEFQSLLYGMVFISMVITAFSLV